MATNVDIAMLTVSAAVCESGFLSMMTSPECQPIVQGID
jgi:hypothetical protein